VGKAGGKFSRYWKKGSTIGGRPVIFDPDDLLLFDLRARLLNPEDAGQPAKRSRKLRKNRGSGPQRLRARVVLRRIWSKEYPRKDEVSDVDVWDRFSKEYERFEGKARPPSRHGKPSLDTVLREMGRRG
jgi:hypothetical protein